MIRAVLFDLDGMLLDIDMDRFLGDYFNALAPVLVDLTAMSARDALTALMDATRAMCDPHPGRTNRTVFDERFAALTGVDLGASPPCDTIERFYAEVFPTLRRTHGPRAGAKSAMAAATQMGFRTVLATNPIFPRTVVVERLRWTGIDAGEFELITTYEHAEACKPATLYFEAIAKRLDVAPVTV